MLDTSMECYYVTLSVVCILKWWVSLLWQLYLTTTCRYTSWTQVLLPHLVYVYQYHNMHLTWHCGTHYFDHYYKFCSCVHSDEITRNPYYTHRWSSRCGKCQTTFCKTAERNHSLSFWLWCQDDSVMRPTQRPQATHSLWHDCDSNKWTQWEWPLW